MNTQNKKLNIQKLKKLFKIIVSFFIKQNRKDF